MCDSLELKNITKVYQDDDGETFAVKDFSYSFKKGRFVSIIGPSGCGKSTLLSIIAGLDTQTSGIIFMDNSKLTSKAYNIGYMLQKDYLLDWRTIYKNVLLGLEIRGKVSEESKDYVNLLLKKYGLYEFKDRYPSQLSGGMRQRAALIRTLATSPDILLLDEAFSALDYQTRLLVTEDVYKIIKAENKITIMVTHDIPESISMSDEIIVLSKRPASTKRVYNVVFDIPDRTPLKCRENQRFTAYFDAVWKELNQDE